MANHGQTARLVSRAEDREPTAADLFDPVALEERLVEARARRAAAIARRKSGESPDAALRGVGSSSRRPRLAPPLEPVPESTGIAATAATTPRRLTRDAVLAAVFVAGLVGGFALVFLAPAGLRQEIAQLIAPESGANAPSEPSIPPVGSTAPIAGDAILPDVAIASVPETLAFPARPGIPVDGVAARPQAMQSAPGAETAPDRIAETLPAGIFVSPLEPAIGLAEAGDGAPAPWSAMASATRASSQAAFAPVAQDVWSGGMSTAALPMLPRIARAPDLAMGNASARWSLPSADAPQPARSAVLATPAAPSAETSPAAPEAGISRPPPVRSPGALQVAGGSAVPEPTQVAAVSSHVQPLQDLAAASFSDGAPDPAAESAALEDAFGTAMRLIEANRPLAVSTLRGLPVFADPDSFAPGPALDGLEDFVGDGKASIFVDTAGQPDVVLATYWPSGELIAAAPVRQASKPAVVRRQQPASAPRQSDQAVAEQVTRIILQRRVERMLRDLR